MMTDWVSGQTKIATVAEGRSRSEIRAVGKEYSSPNTLSHL